MKCECGYTPAVIVHGLGQFESFETDENGGILGRAWPLRFDTERLKRTLLLPAAKMMLLRRDAGFTDRLKKAVQKELDVNASLPDGTPKHNVKVTGFPEPVSGCCERDRKFIYSQVPVEELGEVIGEDHLFYFSYNIFSQLDDTCERLDRFIDSVLVFR